MHVRVNTYSPFFSPFLPIFRPLAKFLNLIPPAYQFKASGYKKALALESNVVGSGEEVPKTNPEEPGIML
jgi:hypothetical protein